MIEEQLFSEHKNIEKNLGVIHKGRLVKRGVGDLKKPDKTGQGGDRGLAKPDVRNKKYFDFHFTNENHD